MNKREFCRNSRKSVMIYIPENWKKILCHHGNKWTEKGG